MPGGAGVGVTGIDHVVMVVRDLRQAAVDLRAVGFTVTDGGRHVEGRTENALIGFADRSYLEIIGFTDAPDAHEHRWWPRLQEGEGLVDHCLGIGDLGRAKEALDAAGARTSPIVESGRVRPDGTKLAWRSIHLGRGYGDLLLPFLVEDLTPRSLRVPAGDAAKHANGVTGIAALRLEAPDDAASLRAYAAVAGQPDQGGFTVGSHRIFVTRGPTARIAGLELRGARGAIDLSRTHGARLLAAA